jgi:hypothetical protein
MCSNTDLFRQEPKFRINIRQFPGLELKDVEENACDDLGKLVKFKGRRSIIAIRAVWESRAHAAKKVSGIENVKRFKQLVTDSEHVLHSLGVFPSIQDAPYIPSSQSESILSVPTRLPPNFCPCSSIITCG